MFTSTVLFAFMGFFARVASAGAHWTLVGAARALTGVAVAVAVARLRGVPVRVSDRRGIGVRSVFGTASMVLTFCALSSRSLSLGDTTTLLNLQPVFIAALSPWVLGERSSPRLAAGIALALAGVVMILRPAVLFGGATLGPDAARTAALAVTASLTSTVAMMTLRRIGQRESAEAIAIYFSLFAAVVFVALSVPHLHAPTARTAAFMAGAGLCAGLGQIAMTRAYALAPAAQVGSISYLGVVASALLGALALHEWPAPAALLGMAMVVTGGLLVVLRPATDKAVSPAAAG